MSIELESAFEVLQEAFMDFEQQSKDDQHRLLEMSEDLQEWYTMSLAEIKRNERIKAEAKRASNAARKKVRDELIPRWCEENLQPGMIIKVKAKNNPWREVEKVRPGYEYGKSKFFIEGELRGQHMHYSRTTQSFKKGSYITNHSLKYVQGVVDGLDERGYPKVIPIMDLVEGRQQLQLDGTK